MSNTPNYPYLCGYLESVIKNLASDYKYSSLGTVEAREAYLLEHIVEAKKSAINYENSINRN